MDLSEIDYALPGDAIAQEPAEPRDAARLLVDRGPGAPPDDRRVADLPELLCPGDLLVVNESRVLRARLRLRKATGASVEVLLLERTGSGWEALVRPSRRLPRGSVLHAGPDLEVEIGEHLPEGRRIVRLRADDEQAAIDRHGALPLPPYIHRPIADPDRYQTVFARPSDAGPQSAAAPTAGLHLTHELLARCRARGIEVAAVDLAVGAGTFRPVTAARVEEHRMHAERYRVPEATMAACASARRVVAVGTTVVRALESAAASGELEGRTALFIHGDHEFRAVDVMLTNFHMPRSSLLALVAAFTGPHWRDLYETALERGYRFLSFGDAMLLERRPRAGDAGLLERRPRAGDAGLLERRPRAGDAGLLERRPRAGDA